MPDQSLKVAEALSEARDAYDDARGAWLRALHAASEVVSLEELTDLTGMSPYEIRTELVERDRLVALVERFGG